MFTLFSSAKLLIYEGAGDEISRREWEKKSQ